MDRIKPFDIEEQMSVPMQPDQELAVAERAASLARCAGFDTDRVDEIRIAVIEAVINAIEHGNNPEKTVHVSLRLERQPKRLEICISDRGAGFDPERVETPDIHKKMLKGNRKRGWGLSLMRSLMDEVSIQTSEAGSRVVLVKKG
ncbi:ATP-binding protein [bacterium]|nr:ATP-binding protein [bacterium]